ncbi:tigger transposable element-derived protein 4-like [Anopheles bellator]|uniref:tigger transposable element-derived protein 4-like n=1 Tax=Anopheles bellator TaxID=139047 RepID=UPI00264A0F79|nr:tigger transposable element-derived protein 4-like [Anopheles bellator]
MKNDLHIKEPSSKECLDDDYLHSQLIEKLIQEYCPQDVFSASATGLFFKCLPNKIKEFKEKTCSDGSLAEQRLTIGLTTNMDGSQKLPLLVIGTEKTPSCFRSEKSFPVIYQSNSNAWITWSLFRNWILEMDKTFQEQQRNVLLFVSDCTGHAKSLQTELAAINLQFLPKEDSPLRQPIRILKKYYRRSLWKLWTDNSEEISVHPDITTLDSINILTEAWSTRIKPETINACFKNAGFSFSDDEEDPLAIYDVNTRDSEIEYESSTLFTEYCAVDKLVTYSGRMEDADFVDSSQGSLQTYDLSDRRKTVIQTDDQKFVPSKGCSQSLNPVVHSTRSKGNSRRKRIRKCFISKLDLALILYIRSSRDNRVWISRKQVRRKALEYAEYLGIDNFKASHGWSKCFFKRCNINFDKLPDENDSQEDDSIESISRLVWQYNISDVFSGVETGLFYKCLPNESKHFHGRRCKDGNLPEQRLTIMCITNMNGSEKLPLLVVGNDKSVKCFSDVDLLPVIYRCNSKSWMTWVLFRDWMLILDRKFAAEQRNVLLFVEESSIHPKSLQAELKAINLHFLPANNSALRLPIKFDVIQLLKKHYRQKLTKFVAQRNGNETPSSEPTVTDSISVLQHVWNNLPSKTIQNSFKVAGFPINDEDPLAGLSDVNETDTSGSENDSSSVKLSTEVNEVDYNLRTHGPISESDILEGVQQNAN